MQYRDIYKIQPGTFEWRYLSPSNTLLTKENGLTEDYFKNDYKAPYKYSPYFLRKIDPYQSHRIITRPKVKEEWTKEIYDRLPEIKDIIEGDELIETTYHEKTLEEKKLLAKSLIADSITFENIVTSQYDSLHGDEKGGVLSNSYLPTPDNIMHDKNIDITDGQPIWHMTYFHSLQDLYDQDEDLKEFHDYKLPVYVGRTKKWQVLSDYLGKEEVDKIQAAIGAPVQDQLDLWEEENSQKTIQMPISNENQAKFRDTPEHYEKLDHDYEQIVYERKRNQLWEKMRNTRHWEMNQYHESHEHHH